MDLLTAIQHALPKHLISRFAGWLSATPIPIFTPLFIRAFARLFHIDMGEARDQAFSSYATFNAFFTRQLQDGSRPIDPDPKSVACPADGVISEIGYAKDGQLIQAKGRNYGVAELLGEQTLDPNFEAASFITVYLSPRDYHRFHMPIDATLQAIRHIPGDLFSVNQRTAATLSNLFARNERIVARFSAAVGDFAFVAVGALCVGGIEFKLSDSDRFGNVGADPKIDSQQSDLNLAFTKGDELGRFLMGSTVIIIGANEIFRWRNDLRAGTPVQVGKKLGMFGAVTPPHSEGE
ncbi:MAG: archaetidylserine decarboxylase [Pseudomonadota bacterium]